MTVESTTNRAQYATNGTTGPWTVPWQFYAKSDVSVIYTDSAGNETALADADYSVTGTGDESGGTVSTTTAYTAGGYITLLMAFDPLQEVDYTETDAFPAETHERALDLLTRLIQQVLEVSNRSLVFSPSDTSGSVLPAAAARANKFLSFNGSGQVTVTAPVSGSAADVLTQLANGGSATQGAALVALNALRSYAAGSVGARLLQTVNVKDSGYGATGDGTTNDTAAVQAAITAANGRPVYMPAGTYRLNTGLTSITTGPDVFEKGLHLKGEGPGKTILDFRGSDYCINIDTDTTLEFQHYVILENLSIIGTNATGTADAVRIRRAYMVSLRDVEIYDMPGDGVAIIMNEGDADGSNMVSLEKVRIWDCSGWGIHSDITGSYNETSYISLKHVFIQNCGTTSGTTPPPSGGMKWKGQVCHIEDSAIVICPNVGLYIPGGGGLANNMTIMNLTLENNLQRGLYCTGIDSFHWNRGQVYNNNLWIAHTQIEFDGASYTVRGVEIDGIIVRATSGNNPLTAFKISGSNSQLDTCRVRNSIWQNFDYTGQTRYSGWQFDNIPQCCILSVESATGIAFKPHPLEGRGNTSPYRLGGSTSEWVPLQVAVGGITRTNSGLANNTRYYIYLYNNAGAPALEITGTAYSLDAASGYNTKTGDTTRLYVGSVHTNGSAEFQTSANGWLNPWYLPASQVGVYARIWMDGSGQLRLKNAADPANDTDGSLIGP